jgi:hypothetical protein
MRALQLFLSYNSADRAWVLGVQKLLRARGITTFLDRDRLVAGLPWPQALERGLKDVQALKNTSHFELGEKSLDTMNQGVSESDHYFHYRPIFQRSVLTERYLKAEISFHLHIGVELLAEEDLEYLCAVFGGPDPGLMGGDMPIISTSLSAAVMAIRSAI